MRHNLIMMSGDHWYTPQQYLPTMADDLPIIKVEQTQWDALSFQVVDCTTNDEARSQGECICATCDDSRRLLVMQFPWARVAAGVVSVADVMNVATNVLITRNGVPVPESESISARLRNLALTDWQTNAVALLNA
jgi:hypothetical protein